MTARQKTIINNKLSNAGIWAHTCLYVQGTQFNVAVGMKKHDATLLAHEHNTYMEALEFIRNWRRAFVVGDVYGPSKEDADAMIAKLETVEGI